MPGKPAAESSRSPHDPDQLKNLLLVLEHARADAWLRKDRRALDSLLSPDFCEINYFGRLKKEDLLERFFSRMTLHTITIEDPLLRMVSDAAAILSYECYEEFTADGKRRKGYHTVAALYSWNGKQWKLALWQITPLCRH